MSEGVLLMAYGTPSGPDQLEAYYTDIRRGVPPPPELLVELAGRYRAIGGRSPLLDITRAQAEGLEKRLDAVNCYVGCKHAAPFLAEAVEAMAKDGVTKAVGLVMAPHYSRLSVGDYESRVVAAAADLGWTGELQMIRNWHLEPGFIQLLADRVQDALERLSRRIRKQTTVIFSAHSLPASAAVEGDPYPEQLRATAEAVAGLAGIDRFTVGWQSAGRTSEPWLGPDILEIMAERAAAGDTGVVICPCGFAADHLEVLYDVDVEARAAAEKLGLQLIRTASPNDDPAFLEMLAGVVRRTLNA